MKILQENWAKHLKEDKYEQIVQYEIERFKAKIKNSLQPDYEKLSFIPDEITPNIGEILKDHIHRIFDKLIEIGINFKNE